MLYVIGTWFFVVGITWYNSDFCCKVRWLEGMVHCFEFHSCFLGGITNRHFAHSIAQCTGDWTATSSSSNIEYHHVLKGKWWFTRGSLGVETHVFTPCEKVPNSLPIAGDFQLQTDPVASPFFAQPADFSGHFWAWVAPPKSSIFGVEKIHETIQRLLEVPSLWKPPDLSTSWCLFFLDNPW